jgi:hypothetical protein
MLRVLLLYYVRPLCSVSTRSRSALDIGQQYMRLSGTPLEAITVDIYDLTLCHILHAFLIALHYGRGEVVPVLD